MDFDEPLTKVVEPKTARLLSSVLDLSTVGDLLRHYPRRYAERGELTAIDALEVDEHVTVVRDTPSGEHSEERVDTPGELPLLAELRSFVSHLTGGPPPRSSAREGSLVVQHLTTLRALAA